MDDWAKALAELVKAEGELYGENITFRNKSYKITIGSTEQTQALQSAGYLSNENLVGIISNHELLGLGGKPKVNELLVLNEYVYRIVQVRNMEQGIAYELQCELVPDLVPEKVPEPIYFTPLAPSEVKSAVNAVGVSDVEAELLTPLGPSLVSSNTNPIPIDELQVDSSPRNIDQLTSTITEVDLYLIAGQSNAHGHSPIADLSGTQVDDINIGFYTSWHHGTSDATSTQYYSNYVSTMELGKTRGDAGESSLDSDYFGIEWGFAKKLEEQNVDNKEIGIVKYAIGASKILDDATYSDWDISKDTEAWGGLKLAIADVITKLRLQGKTPIWKGILWYQGESDSQMEPYIYKDALNNLLAEIETELETANLPAVFIAPADASGNDLNVNNAHASLARSADYYDFIKASDYHDGTYNNVHLSAENMYDAGEASAIAMANAVAGTATDVEFEPSTNISFWIDGDDASLVTENSSTHVVTSVSAKAGNIDILPRSKDANPVEIIHEHNAIANRDCFTMSHDREYLETDGLVNMPTSTHDWFVVARPNGINHGQDAIWSSETARSITLIPLGTNTYTWFWNNTPVSSAQGTSSLDGELSLFCIRWNFNGQHTSTWFNGTQRDSQRSIGSASNFSMVDLRFHFMAQYAATNTTDGNFCEAIVSTATADRVKIEGYLAHKWGIANKLPASHAYKYYAP